MKNKFNWSLGAYALLLVQIALCVTLCVIIALKAGWIISVVLKIFSVILSLCIAAQHKTIPFRIGWIILIIICPCIFIVMYFIFGSGRELKRIGEMKCKNNSVANSANPEMFEIAASKGCPDENFIGSQAEYLGSGGEFFSSLINDIRNARKYIFLEFFIVGDGQIWSAIYNELCQYLDRQVQIFVLYDYLGTGTRIITPNIPNKKYVFRVTRANYLRLLKSGVKIFEYTCGFIHSKAIIVDDERCYIGSANIDYRSLYLNFECGIYTKGTKAVSQSRDDFTGIFASSKEIPPDDKSVIKAEKSIINNILRLISSLF